MVTLDKLTFSFFLENLLYFYIPWGLNFINIKYAL